MIGHTFKTNEGYIIKIISYLNNKNVTVVFDNGYIVKSRLYDIKKGNIKNPFHITTYGVGYIGIGGKADSKSYDVWRRMIERCYSKNGRNPTYKDCIVCKEWHNYSFFNSWFKENNILGFQLDKDILIKGNKIYSPETCCFVPQEINKLFIKREAKRGLYPIGVNLHKTTKKYVSQININGNSKHLGLFNTVNEAFLRYKLEKEIIIKTLANEYKSVITQECYNALIKYEVNFCD